MINRQRIIIEMGSGTDFTDQSATKAACLAVQNTSQNAVITLFSSLGYDIKDMEVNITIGVANPDEVDLNAVESHLAVGRISIKAVQGGLTVIDPRTDETFVTATAAIECFAQVSTTDWKLEG